MSHGDWTEDRDPPVIEGVGPGVPSSVNEFGGKQADVQYRFDLLDGLALFATARVLDEGAKKYGANNWRAIDVAAHLNHMILHAYAYLAGDQSDEHLSHITCRAIFALGVELQGGPVSKP